MITLTYHYTIMKPAKSAQCLSASLGPGAGVGEVNTFWNYFEGCKYQQNMRAINILVFKNVLYMLILLIIR